STPTIRLPPSATRFPYTTLFRSLPKATALDAAGSRVTCNAICPGWVLTPLVQQQVDALAEQEGVDQESAKSRLVSEKMPSGEFRSEEHTSELQSREKLVCRLLLD